MHFNACTINAFQSQEATDPNIGSSELSKLKNSIDHMQFEFNMLQLKRKKLIRILEFKVDCRKVITSKMEVSFFSFSFSYF